MNKGRVLGISSSRQRSLFISELKQLGHLHFVSHEYDGLNEVSTLYECTICHKKLERRLIVPHFRSDMQHFEVGFEIILTLISEGEMSQESYIENIETK